MSSGAPRERMLSVSEETKKKSQRSQLGRLGNHCVRRSRLFGILNEGMGNVQKKLPQEPDPRTGLTASECKLVRRSWHDFCIGNGDYGVLIFTLFFVKSPESLMLFGRFRGKPVGSLPDDPNFRAHACSVGYQLTSMLEFVDDPPLLEALIKKNALAHRDRIGVTPEKFVVLGQTVIEVLSARSKKLMTPATVAAWGKLFAFMNAITVKVFQEDEVIPLLSKDGTNKTHAHSDVPAGAPEDESAGINGTQTGGVAAVKSPGTVSSHAASPGNATPAGVMASPKGAERPTYSCTAKANKTSKSPHSPTSPRRST